MFSLTKDQDNNILTKNSKPCSCPFQSRLVLPHPQIQGQLVIQQFNCNSGCMFFFEHINEDGKPEVLTSCTGTRFEIETPIDNSNIIHSLKKI